MKHFREIISFFVITILVVGTLGCGPNLTAETNGLVIKTEAIKERKTTRRKTRYGRTKKKTKTVTAETDIDYTYEVNGTKYEGVSEWEGDMRSKFKEGAQVKVCYNPKNPEESDLFLPDEKCGS